MARFVVLKGGASYKIFEFDGNIARIGSGETMDLNLDAPGFAGDLFFLTKSANGYEIERRNDTLTFNINGAPGGSRVRLNDGDKVAFLDYLIVATYPPTLGAAVHKPEPQHTPEPPPPPKVSKDTAPVASAAAPPPPPPPPPMQPPRSTERPTTIIDSSAMMREAHPRMPSPPPVQRDPQGSGAKPAVPPTDAVRADRPAPVAPRKPRIAPVYSLVGLAGQYKGQVREIDTREYVVGRDGSLSDLVVDRTESGELDNSVSREHFTILATDEGLSLLDKKSRLRTYINGKVIEPNQRESIAPEDIISIPVPTGEVKFRLCFVGNENFSPDKGRGKYLPIIIGLAVIITLLIVATIWLLGD